MKAIRNIYIPSEATIAGIEDLSRDVRRFTVETRQKPEYRAGQFFMLSLYGFGEVPISVSSVPSGPLEFCIRKAGRVTGALHGLVEGDRIGLRGPYGNGFDLEPARGRDVVLVAGGLGIVPLRPVIKELIRNRDDHKAIYLLYGSRSPSEILFGEEARVWEESGVKTIHTVDCAEGDWCGCVGLVTSQLDAVGADFTSSTAFVSGPGVMIRAAMEDLSSREVPDERIIATLEAHMKCGVGKCGHCFLGPKYICTDGPVFTYGELKGLSKV